MEAVLFTVLVSRKTTKVFLGNSLSISVTSVVKLKGFELNWYYVQLVQQDQGGFDKDFILILKIRGFYRPLKWIYAGFTNLMQCDFTIHIFLRNQKLPNPRHVCTPAAYFHPWFPYKLKIARKLSFGIKCVMPTVADSRAGRGQKLWKIADVLNGWSLILISWNPTLSSFI